jgi:hypothetical protein
MKGKMADIELDDEGRVIKDDTEGPVTWANVGKRLTEYPSSLVRPRSEDEKQSISSAILVLKNRAAMKAEPAALKMEQAVPGASAVRGALERLSERRAVRQPVSMSREFPDTPQGNLDQEKYIHNRLVELAQSARTKKP